MPTSSLQPVVQSLQLKPKRSVVLLAILVMFTALLLLAPWLSFLGVNLADLANLANLVASLVNQAWLILLINLVTVCVALCASFQLWFPMQADCDAYGNWRLYRSVDKPLLMSSSWFRLLLAKQDAELQAVHHFSVGTGLGMSKSKDMEMDKGTGWQLLLLRFQLTDSKMIARPKRNFRTVSQAIFLPTTMLLTSDNVESDLIRQLKVRCKFN